ncbi:MAG: hypothetical protein GDA36_06755 [Rhodobacteraceae bacterium]|nr:hypothetical protein [Paracoccaceae bacterium]
MRMVRGISALALAVQRVRADGQAGVTQDDRDAQTGMLDDDTLQFLVLVEMQGARGTQDIKKYTQSHMG